MRHPFKTNQKRVAPPPKTTIKKEETSNPVFFVLLIFSFVLLFFLLPTPILGTHRRLFLLAPGAKKERRPGTSQGPPSRSHVGVEVLRQRLHKVQLGVPRRLLEILGTQKKLKRTSSSVTKRCCAKKKWFSFWSGPSITTSLGGNQKMVGCQVVFLLVSL